MRRKRLWKATICVFAFFAMNIAQLCFALPQIDEVKSGSAQATYSDNNTTLTITATDKAIINYKSFDIAEHEKVFITLPSSSGEVLNRVTGPNASFIYGSLSSNGIVYLVNPNGINIGPNANINAASLVLSTRDITNTNFLNSNYVFEKFSNATLDRLLVNRGTITIKDGGFGVLIAGGIDNTGVITARVGTIALASGDMVNINMGGDNRISVAVTRPVAATIVDTKGNPITKQVSSSGRLVAEGGTVVMPVESLVNIFEKSVNIDGYVKASSIEAKDGTIRIVTNGSVGINATLEAGRIDISAKDVILSQATHLVATDRGIAIAVTGNITTQAEIETVASDIDLFADYDQNGAGQFTQSAGTIKAGAQGNVHIDGSGIMTLKTIQTDTGAIRIGTRQAPTTIAGNPHYIHTQGDIEIVHKDVTSDITTLTTTRNDVLRHSTTGTVTLEAVEGKIIDRTIDTPIPAQYLRLIAQDIAIKSDAITTEIYRTPGDLIITATLPEANTNYITLQGEHINVTYLKSNNVTLKSDGLVATEPGAILQGNTVTVIARQFGTSTVPLAIDAVTTNITRTEGAIDILASTGIGTSILLRGPPEGGFGSILYTHTTKLTLDAIAVRLISESPTYLYGDITFYNFACTIPDKEIYFEAGHTYTFRGSVSIVGAADRGAEEYYIKLRSQTPGNQWHLLLATEITNLDRINVSDCSSLSPVFIKRAINAGNNTNLTLDPIWDNGNSTNLWSDPLNWDGNAVPTGSDPVTFDGAVSSDGCIIDNNTGSWSGGTFTIEDDYTGVITMQTDLTVSSFSQSNGTFVVANHYLNITGDLTISGGTFTGTGNVAVRGGDVTGNGTINLTGGTFLVDGDGSFGGTTNWTFYNLTFGDGSAPSAITAKASTNSITVIHTLTIAAYQTLQAGTNSMWNLTWGENVLADIKKIAVGGAHVLALSGAGAVYAWGYNNRGQLGDGTTDDSTTPIQVLGVGGTGTLSDIIDIGTGNFNSYAVAANGTVYAWGDNTYGQLGDNKDSGDMSTAPVQVHGVGNVGTLSSITSVTGGLYYAVALSSAGVVYAWGANNYGQLGDNKDSGAESDVPVQVHGVGNVGMLSSIRAIACGLAYAATLDSAGSVYTWGRNTSGQLGDGTTTDSWVPVQVLKGAGPGSGLTISDIKQIACGQDHTIAVSSAGAVYAWGDNVHGQLGDGNFGPGIYSTTPVQVVGVGGSGTLSGIVQVSGGAAHTLALGADGAVYAWGMNSDGEVGDSTTTDRHTPVVVVGVSNVGKLSTVKQVCAWVFNSGALTASSQVRIWGDNTVGQVGNGTSGGDATTPTVTQSVNGVQSLTNIIKIYGGTTYSMALLADGTIYAWGDNSSGQLGDNTTTVRYTPIQVHGVGNVGYLTGIITLKLGSSHVLALGADGSVYAWGNNGNGKLGDNTTTDRYTPIQVHGVGDVGYLSGIIEVDAGIAHSLALGSDGSVYAWGSNGFGQLGDNTKTDRYTPIQVHGVGDVGYLSGIVQIAAGSGGFSMALASTGAVYSWGVNGQGQLGDGTISLRKTPVQVHGVGDVGYLSNIIQIASGNAHTLALASDGTVYAWGKNEQGQLGDGTTNNSLVPIQVHGVGDVGYLSDAISISAGYDHSIVITSDGLVYAWGSNSFGQLGDHGDSGTQSALPVGVHGLSNVGYLTGIICISGGYNHTLALSASALAYAWGDNYFGQLGNGTTTSSSVPVLTTLTTITPTSFASFTIAGTFTCQTSTVSYLGDYPGGNTNIASATYNNLIINNTAETFDLAGAIVTEEDLTITAGTLDVTTTNYAITCGGDWTNDGTFVPRAGTVTLAGDDPMAVSTITTGGAGAGKMFYNLIVDSADINQVFGDLRVTNDLTIENGRLYEDSDLYDVTVDGDYSQNGGTLIGFVDITINGTTTISGGTLNAGHTRLFQGVYTINGGADLGALIATFNSAVNVFGGTVMFGETVTINGDYHQTAGAASMNINNPSQINGNFTMDGGTFQLLYTQLAITGDISINGGTFSFDDYWGFEASLIATNITIGVGAVLECGTDDHRIAVSGDWSNSGTFTAGGSITTFNGAARQSITAGGSSFNDVIFANTFVGDNIQYTGALTIGGATTLSENTSIVSTNDTGITFNGAINGGYALSINSGTGTIALNGDAGVTTSLTSFDATGDAITVAKVFTAGGQEYTGTTTFEHLSSTVSGSITINGAAHLKPAGAAPAMSVHNGDIIFTSTFDDAIAGFNSIVIRTDSGTILIQGAVGGTTPLANLIIMATNINIQSVDTTAAQSYIASGGIIVNGSLASANSGAIAFTGPVTLATGPINIQTAGGIGDNITFSSTIDGAQPLTLDAGVQGDITITGPIGGTTRLGALSITNAHTVSLPAVTAASYAQSGGTTTLGGDMNLTADFASTGGTFATGAHTITVGRNFTAAASAFTADAGSEVIFVYDLYQTSEIYGTTFVDFTCTDAGKILRFEAGATETITGTTTIGAAVGDQIQLLSTVSGTRWNIDPNNTPGALNIQNVYVRDSANLNGSYIDPINSTNGGNTVMWFTPTPEPPNPPGPNPDNPDIQPQIPNPPVTYEEEKFKKRYPKGKYRTTVIVYEGRVVVTPYDEQGMRYKEEVYITDGEKIQQVGDVK